MSTESAHETRPLCFAFDDFELDLDLYQLRFRGRVIPLAPRNFDVLVYLLRHRERVVTKRELLDRVWGSQFVSESVLPRCIHEIRHALADSAPHSRCVETVRGRGYRFVAHLEMQPAGCPQCGHVPGRSGVARIVREGNRKPSIRNRPLC